MLLHLSYVFLVISVCRPMDKLSHPDHTGVKYSCKNLIYEVELTKKKQMDFLDCHHHNPWEILIQYMYCV